MRSQKTLWPRSDADADAAKRCCCRSWFWPIFALAQKVSRQVTRLRRFNRFQANAKAAATAERTIGSSWSRQLRLGKGSGCNRQRGNNNNGNIDLHLATIRKQSVSVFVAGLSWFRPTRVSAAVAAAGGAPTPCCAAPNRSSVLAGQLQLSLTLLRITSQSQSRSSSSSSRTMPAKQKGVKIVRLDPKAKTSTRQRPKKGLSCLPHSLPLSLLLPLCLPLAAPLVTNALRLVQHVAAAAGDSDMSKVSI